MEADRSDRIRAIFSAAVVLTSPGREQYVASACAGDTQLQAEVESLLYSATQEGPPVAAPAGTQERVMRLGPYRIVRELGRGGMGVVFLAVRDDGAFRKNVALKLLIPDENAAMFADRFRQNARSSPDSNTPTSPASWSAATLPTGRPSSSWSLSKVRRWTATATTTGSTSASGSSYSCRSVPPSITCMKTSSSTAT